MLPVFITFTVSLVGMILLIGLKMSIFRERHLNLWVSVRQVSDNIIHKTASWTKERSGDVKRKGLLKLVSLVYYGLIPFVDRQYRKLASISYKLHRRFSGVIEYSKSSTKNVSEYLHHLSEDKDKEEVKKDETVVEENKVQ